MQRCPIHCYSHKSLAIPPCFECLSDLYLRFCRGVNSSCEAPRTSWPWKEGLVEAALCPQCMQEHVTSCNTDNLHSSRGWRTPLDPGRALKCCDVPFRVHGANKLAAKHDRVELGKAAEPVQCDICQDRPAVLFCSEDRALICRRCGLLHLSTGAARLTTDKRVR